MTEQNNQLDERTMYILRVVPLVVSILPVAILTLVRWGHIDSTSYTEWGYSTSVIGLVVLGIVQYFWLPETPAKDKFYIAAYHIVAVAMYAFVLGYDSFLVIGWLILIICTDAYFGMRAGIMSFLAYVASIGVWRFLHPEISTALLLEILIQAVFIGCVAYVVSHFRQMSAKSMAALKRSQEESEFQRRQLAVLVDSMSDAVIATDEAGVVEIHNAATQKLFDLHQGITGMHIDDALRITNRAGEAMPLMKEAQAGAMAHSRTDLTYIFKPGEVMRLYASIAPISKQDDGGAHKGYMFILRDITQEKILDDEREEFISIVSHELRTPIAVMSGSLESIGVLQKRGAPATEITAAVDRAYSQSRSLATLVNGLDILSNADQKPIDTHQKIQISALLHELYDKYAPQARRHNLELRLQVQPDLPLVLSNETYLTEVLQHLLSNAIKYTSRGYIALEAKMVGDKLQISVQDTGIGVSKSDQQHLYEKFFRADNALTRQTGGTGIGLYLCKKLCSKLGLGISHRTELNEGSTFIVEVPASLLEQPTTNKE